MRSFRAVRAGVVATALVLVPAAASAAISQPVVKANAADYTPQLVPTTAVPSPEVNGIAVSATSGLTYAGGRFDKVTGSAQDFGNVVAFNTATGAVRDSFHPRFNNLVRDVEDAADGGAYVGGDFTTLDGATIPNSQRLVKLNPDGTRDTAFKPTLIKGIVQDVDLYDGHLLVAGSFGRRLVSLNPNTGVADGYINATFAGAATNTNGTRTSWGAAGTVYDVAASATPQGDRLIAVGNFTSVNGVSRGKFAMLNLPGGALNNWYYNAFATPCATDAPRRIANLQGVDWSPGGTHFDVGATGQIPEFQSQVWHHGVAGDQATATVCDGVGRFALADDSRADWINYTGGDSVWEVADTGAAVYMQGHFKYVDNADGFGSRGIGDKVAGTPAARRSGIAAINPQTGYALAWNPAVPTKTGGRALEVTSQGLWVGSDSSRFGAEAHYGIAFAPAP
jgi:hypothetical protein